MEFIEVAAREAAGAIAAHSVRQGELVIRKGQRITDAHVDRLAENGVERIIVARLGDGDKSEDEVAFELARRAAGAHARAGDAFTGRSNIFSDARGVLRVNVEGIDRFNQVDERITIATLPAWRVVEPGEMIGTVKIIPFAVESDVVARVASVSDDLISVAPFIPHQVGVVSTLLPGLKSRTVAKTLRALEGRLDVSHSRISREARVAHEIGAVADELKEMSAGEAELLIVFGASAVTDRRDVIPAAIEAAGGTLVHVGMPVDPGNLLVLGELRGKPVIGAPGCARSPRENGFDWVLQRLLAHIPVTRADIMRMGVGGLLMEIGARGQPRDAAPEDS
ncbi:molybdopterin-binding protein [Terrarubrum flagellatum]|uniref:molybdopterin-binding protein n=1 Tax=Terrirubrum flagellatum TaxID=2895980 RepID=UPI003145662B